MNYTKGKWEVSKSASGDWIIATDEEVICREVRHYNAPLIITAVNACASVNPDNPMAVAESIKEMYEALKQLHTIFGDDRLLDDEEFRSEVFHVAKLKRTINDVEARIKALILLRQALAKAEGK